MKKIGSDTFFNLWPKVGQHSNWNFTKSFNRAQNPGVEKKKTLGQDLSIGSSLDKIELTNAEK